MNLKLASIPYAAVLLIALYISLKTVFYFLGLDSDSAQSIMLWYGIKSGGWSWLHGWGFTTDNWLLSIVPFNFLCFFLFGPKPFLIIFSGWLTFILSALVSGVLAAQLGARRAACLIPVVLLCLGSYAQTRGYVAYAASHDITNLYGLASLSFLIRWTQTHSCRQLFLVFLLLTIGSVSDPWMLAAYDLPALILSGIFLLRPNAVPNAVIDRRNAASLLLVVLTVVFATKTHLFWLLRFLPNPPFKAADWPLGINNLFYLGKDLGGLLNIFPEESSNRPVTAFLSLALVASGLLVCFFARARPQAVIKPNVLIVFGFMVLSVSITAMAFVFVNVVASNISARFILNCLYFIVIAFGVLLEYNWGSLSNDARIFLLSLAFLFFISGLASTARAWGSAGFTIQDNGVNAFIAFLAANNLSYGYGPYHGVNANAVTAVSGDKIRVRPVLFNADNGMMITKARPGAARQWFTPEDFLGGQKEFFVFVKRDGEVCPDVDLCMKGLLEQFGSPARILKYGPNATILVWNHSLLGYPYDVEGNYWNSPGWTWMGGSIVVTSQKPLNLMLKGAGLGSPRTDVQITIDGRQSDTMLAVGETESISIPANSVTKINASPFVGGHKIVQNKKKKTLLIDLPQPAP